MGAIPFTTPLETAQASATGASIGTATIIGVRLFSSSAQHKQAAAAMAISGSWTTAIAARNKGLFTTAN